MRANLLLSCRRRIVSDVLEPGLRAIPEIDFVGNVPDLDHIAEALRPLEPSILVLDLGVGLLRNMMASEAILSASRETALVLLLPEFTMQHAMVLARTHTACFVCESAGLRGVITAVRRLANGRCPHVRGTSWCAASFARMAGLIKGSTTIDELSEREREVMTLLTQGWTSSEMGQRLFISPRTVEHYVASLFIKLAVHDKRVLSGSVSDEGPGQITTPDGECPLRGRCMPPRAGAPKTAPPGRPKSHIPG